MHALVGISLCLPAIGACAPAEAQDPLPNIVLVLADDMGFECVGANGGTSYETPVLDAMAAGGMRFEHCYSQPLCTPSRVQLMTGQYNVRNYVRFGHLDRESTTFAHLLGERGYATGIAGKWQLGRLGPERFGFDEHCVWRKGEVPATPLPKFVVDGARVQAEAGTYGPDFVSDYACDFIARHADRPFFLYYTMMLPHSPFSPTPDSPEWRAGEKPEKSDPRYFGAMVSYADKLVGRILAEVERHGLRERTLVLFTCDNGSHHSVRSRLGEREIQGGKKQSTDAGTHVPLIASWPGTVPGGLVCDDLVDFSDFLPTFSELVSAPLPDDLVVDGRSFLPQLRGESGDPRRWVYSWYSRNGVSTPREFARTRRFKLYRTGELYDVVHDPDEREPLDPAQLDPEALNARDELGRVLAGFADARPAELTR